MNENQTITPPPKAAVVYRAGSGAGLINGRYTAEISGITPGTSAAGNAKLVVEVRIASGGKSYKVTDHLSLVGGSRTDQFFATTAGVKADDEIVILNEDRTLSPAVKAILGKRVVVDIENAPARNGGGGSYPGIVRYLPA